MSYDSDVVSATSSTNGSNTDWDKIIKLCDRIRDSHGSTAMGSALASIMKRVKHTDRNVQLQTLTLLESCVSNCGKDFQLELTKSSFHAQVRDLLSKHPISPDAVNSLKSLLLSWCADYRNDRGMSGLITFVDQLVSEGIIVPQRGGGATRGVTSSTQPNPSSEEDDIQKAIRLSLEEAKSSSSSTTTMYPTFSPQQAKRKESTGAKKVRALYDFEAIEDNELSFKAGEIITVTNDSDDNWWRGETQLGSGLFPVTFVSTDLNALPEPVVKAKDTNSNNTAANNTKNTTTGTGRNVSINEAQVDLLLEMLKTADITSTTAEENKTLKDLEAECTEMKKMVEVEIENYQKQLDDMTIVSTKLQESFQQYRRLLQEGPKISEKASMAVQSSYSSQPHEVPPPYQNESSYFAPPPPPDGGFQTLPPLSMGYGQPYGVPISGGYGPPVGGYMPPSLGHNQPSLQSSGQPSLPPPPPAMSGAWGAPPSGGGPGEPSLYQPLVVPQHLM